MVEVTGRHAGWIARHSGLAGGADVILIRSSYAPVVVVAEGAVPKDGDLVLQDGSPDPFGHVRLSGVGAWPAEEIGGAPARGPARPSSDTSSAFDRRLATPPCEALRRGGGVLRLTADTAPYIRRTS